METTEQGQALIAPNQGKVWSTEDQDQLKHLFMHGFDLKALCDRMGRTPHGIVAKLTQLGLIYIDQKSGHYFPCPTEPWAMWQELKSLSDQYKPRNV
jgi:hypothetical protein